LGCLVSAANKIKELTRNFRYVVLKPLVVATDGTGTVTSGFLGTTQRELGSRYSITARAGVGWLFDHWSGSVESQSAVATFVMAEGATLTAHFRVNPFYALKGAYNGLVAAETAAHATSGFLKLSLAVTGRFSGRLTLGGKAYSVSGIFSETGAAQVTIKRGLLPPLTVTLQLDLAGGSNQITGAVTDGEFVAAFSADQALPALSKHFAAGRYTISLPPDSQDTATDHPQGAGSAVLLVSPLGVASMSGTLADGRAFTAGATVSKDGELPIYVPLLSGTGSLAGRAAFDAETGLLDGAVLWTKPQRLTDRYFPAAFASTIDVVGARYTAPKAGVTVFGVASLPTSSTLELTGGDLPSEVQQPATLLPTNVVAIVNPELPRLALTIVPSTGRVTGSFTHPVTKAASRISGIVLQNRNAVAGFFLGKSVSGAANFAPTP
jgi:hypothetical protein